MLFENLIIYSTSLKAKTSSTEIFQNNNKVAIFLICARSNFETFQTAAREWLSMISEINFKKNE